jgi:GDP-D-mannose 3', 5'-epimerase
MAQLTLVTGAGGFIGGQTVRDLLAKAVPVRAVDKKPVDEWYFRSSNAENLVADLQLAESCDRVTKDVAHVYNLAADMGGMGFIESNKALCMLSVLINTHMLMAAQKHGVDRFFYSSSACVYPGYKQTDADVIALKESDAYPADAEDGYGWEKLFSERLCRHFREDFGLKTRVARYHNVYGPYGTWDGGREKAPAAVSRKVAMAVITGKHEIEIWGDGKQTRSFMYIDDCLIGTQKLLHSDVEEPINIGSEEMVTINQLVDIVEEIAGVKLKRNYKLDAPKGVRGRNSDNTHIKARLGWAPSIPLRTGMEQTYRWIYDQAKARHEGRPYTAAAA